MKRKEGGHWEHKRPSMGLLSLQQQLPFSCSSFSKKSCTVFHNFPSLWILLFCLCHSQVVGAKVELEGPSFLLEPASVTYFSNSVGVIMSCLSRGHPPLSTVWLTANGDPVLPVPGLRENLPNNSLYFGSFKPEEYSPTVHNGQYRCSVTNPIGTILSRVFSVRAIVDHPFEVYIADGGVDSGEAIEGNPMILHCDVTPSFYREFIQIISWKSVDQFGYETEIQSDSRFQITSRGLLIIFAAKYQQLFVCVAQNTLNTKTHSSAPFMVKTKAGVSGVPPKSTRRWEQVVSAQVGKPADLVCPAASGSPPPDFVWLKYQAGGGSMDGVPVVVVPGNGVEMRGPLLSFSRVDVSQNGTYRCEVTNSFGSFVLDITLIVIPNPTVTIEPRRKLLQVGQSLEMTCKTSPFQNTQVTWYKNGKPVLSGSRVKVAPFKLLIFNAAMEDQAIYQCFVQVGPHNIQASSQLVFEASKPELLHTFISQSLQAGPSISLKCSAIGNPIPSIKWFLDGTELLPSPNDPLAARFWQMSDRYSIGSFRLSTTEIVSHINISQVRIEDGGDVRCLAKNLINSVGYSARLNIYGPLFIKEMPSLTLVSGKTAYIPCMYGGYPVDQIIWRKNARDLVSMKQQQSQSNQRQGSPTTIPRYSILANGTLRIEQISTGDDKGTYTCVISNRKGEVATGTVNINVMKPPVISAFKFDENQVEGQRASITCNVMSGDLPIEIIWLKDFQQIPSYLNITEMPPVKFLSYLIFEELRQEHSGTYTCSASNAAAEANYSAILNVKVAPKWIHEPEEARVILRTDHVLPCVASGVPKPSIKWYRGYRESGSGLMKTEIKTDRKFELGDDGSLKIRNVESSEGGSYVCEAMNGVGNGIWKSIQLHVNIPATVSAPMTSVVVAEGLSALLKCQVRGDGPIVVEWKKNSIVLEQSTRMVLQTVLDANSSVLSAELRIQHTERTDSGIYLCSGSNNFGRDEDRISLEVKARPSPPEDFVVEECGSRFIRLRWSLGPQTLSSVPVTYFILQYKKSSTISWTAGSTTNNGEEGEEIFNTTVQSPATHAVLEHVNPVTNYDIRIFASNEIGHSLPSEPLVVITLPEAPSGPPLNVSALPVNSKTILVRWEAPAVNLQHGAILGYHVFITLSTGGVSSSTSNNGGGVNNNTTLIVDEKWSHQTQVQGLRSNSQYRITVRAYNSAGTGPESPFVGVHTPEGAPDASPTELRCEALSPKSLQIQWEPPPPYFTNGVVQGYKVIYQPVFDEKIGEKLEEKQVKKTSNRETTLHGLSSFTNYSVRTLAYTLGGEGLLSEPVFCLTETDVPEEVGDLKVVLMTSNTVLVSWLPPLYPNGKIIKYTIFWKSDDMDSVKEKSVAQLEDELLFLEIRRLKENQRYYFWMTATTSAGAGKPSRMETLLLTTKVQARIASFPAVKNALIDQPLLLPCKTVGQPNPRVSWLRNGRPVSAHHLMKNNSLFFNRIKDQDEGVLTCRAENPYGSDEIQHRIVISRPPSKVPIFLGYVTATTVQLHWELPQSEPVVTGFILQYQKDNSMEWTVKKLGPRVSSMTLENLSCGTPYKFKMAAENSIGIGEESGLELGTKTNGNIPETPKLTDILDGNGTMIRIDLTRWGDGGCPITNFHIEYKPRESANWQRIYRKDNTTRVFTFVTMVKMKYDIRVSIENDAGSVLKTFHVDSVPEFFANYGVLERTEERSNSTSILLTDPHVFVPIASAVICTCAVIVCILIVCKRRSQTKDEWKFGPSASQQTWLSSEDNGQPKTDGGGNKYSTDRPECGPGNMSIYATLNSTKPIAMAIRDSTVRFQTFGQRDNYDAPVVIPTNYYKKNRRKSSSSPPDAINHLADGPCPGNQTDFSGQLDTRNYHYFEQMNHSDSDETTDSLYTNNYSRPYQQNVPRIANEMVDRSGGGRNTLKKKQMLRNRGSREYLD